MRKLEGCFLRPFPNLFFTLLAINKSIYYTLNEIYIHINYLHCNTYCTSFVKKQSPKGVLQKCVLRNFTKFTLLKKRSWHKCFPANFVKFLRTPFLKEHLWWLVLKLLENDNKAAVT